MSIADLLAFSNSVNRVVCLHTPTYQMESVGAAYTFLPWHLIDNGDFKSLSKESFDISCSSALDAVHFVALFDISAIPNRLYAPRIRSVNADCIWSWFNRQDTYGSPKRVLDHIEIDDEVANAVEVPIVESAKLLPKFLNLCQKLEDDSETKTQQAVEDSKSCVNTGSSCNQNSVCNQPCDEPNSTESVTDGREFGSFEGAVSAFVDEQAALGFKVKVRVKDRIKNTKGDIVTIRMVCSRFAVFVSQRKSSTVYRERDSQKCDCKWRVTINRASFKVTASQMNHNHEPGEIKPQNRVKDEDEATERIRLYLKSNVNPA
jgi:hypothetical protein